MLQHWVSKTSVSTVADDARTLTLNVIARAGFGQSFAFTVQDAEGTSTSREAPTMSYRDSLKIILENCILILALGPKFLTKSWLPAKFQRLHAACDAFQKHMTAVYEEAKHALAESNHTATNRTLMTSLVRASQANASESKSGGGALTEAEIYGNMFVFNFAGHDTTAHTFTFALYFLAANPNVQDWLAEEIRAVLGDRQPGEWSAQRDFPRLKRCLAVLYETLRLYLPVPPAKWTENSWQQLRVGDRMLTIPPQTMVFPSYAALQTDPRYWGPDPLAWRPQRWIRTGDDEQEEMITPARGTFMGWSEGARDCPGRKFSQVEFVATVATVFRGGRVDPVVQSGEDMGAARRRVLNHIMEDTGYVLLMQMLHPEKCPLVWKSR